MGILRIVAVLLLAGLGFLFWPSVRDWRHAPAAPTRLAAGESPAAVLCRIRAEFLALPVPAHSGFTQHPHWTRSKLGAPTLAFGPFWEIDLGWAASRFARRHSRLETVAAIGPYLDDPQLAPQAAAILAGLPVGSRERLGQVQSFAIQLAEPDKFTPGAQAPAPWNEAQRRYAQGALAPLYGPENAAARLRQDDGPGPSPAGTLEGVLLDILAANGHADDPAGHWPQALVATTLFPTGRSAATSASARALCPG